MNNHQDLKIEITRTLHRLGIPASLHGFRYLRDAILLVCDDPSYLDSITKRLYPDIARIYHITASRVERSIRHAIEVAALRGDLNYTMELFAYSIDIQRGRATNSEFIALVSDEINLKINADKAEHNSSSA